MWNHCCSLAVEARRGAIVDCLIGKDLVAVDPQSASLVRWGTVAARQEGSAMGDSAGQLNSALCPVGLVA